MFRTQFSYNKIVFLYPPEILFGFTQTGKIFPYLQLFITTRLISREISILSLYKRKLYYVISFLIKILYMS
jgi:hypothetical protein